MTTARTARKTTARKTLLPAGGSNALAIASQLVADEWNIWILGYALIGVRRFSDWKRRGNISNAALSHGLTQLTEWGLFERAPYQDRPVRFEYNLTARGRSIWPALVGVWAWERIWAQKQPAFEIQHLDCRTVLEPRMECPTCRLPVAGRDLTMTVGPSGGWIRSIPDVSNRRRSRPEGDDPDAFAETMTLIGDRWSWAVLGAAFRGVTRHSEFTQFLGGPAPTITGRLRAFCSIGVMVAEPDPERTGWFDYRLTSKGRAFLPIVLATVDWGQRHFRSPEGTALIVRHKLCGNVFHPMMVCSNCTHPVHFEGLLVVGP